jgi:hypothetical protein
MGARFPEGPGKVNRITRSVIDRFTREIGPGITDITALTRHEGNNSDHADRRLESRTYVRPIAPRGVDTVC